MIFVTGGSGLIGIRLLFDLLSKGYNVIALKREYSKLEIVEKCFSFYGNKDLFSQIQWITGNILDEYSYRDFLNKDTTVYHCAATVSFNPNKSKYIYRNNVIGTKHIINACLEANVKKLCYVSSVAVFGNPCLDNNLITESIESTQDNFGSMYALSKFEGELEVWRGIAEGLCAVIVNPSVVLGIGNRNSSSNQLFNRVQNGFKYYTKGITGFVDVKDVSKCMISLMESNIQGERFILNSENLNFKNVMKLMAKELNVKAPTIEIKPWVSSLGWRLDWVRKYLFFQARKFTKSMARSLYEKKSYSSKKIKRTLDISFIPIKKTIENHAKFYKFK